METRVQLCEGPDIRSFGFSFTDLDVLSSYDADFGFLLGVSSEREYVHDGKMIKMIVLELTDPRIATPDSGAHYCKGFDKHVYVTIPRFRVKANVFDGETNFVFVIFDGDMQYLIQKECPSLVVSVQALKFAEENLVTPDCDVVDNSTDDCSFDVIIVDDDDSDINVGMSAVKRKAQEGQYWTQRRT
ncbi:hypothetical protein TSUD_147580 [Trifolium subterraneum]|uniref:Uncharacterized protein n=1 Tax=Trifolium subterraneum TaxID=3900 RepID=A0A2Z6NP39_TRISU|nr:hypothetical protein TSUD_147580 [Trifolium subterraneum]